MQTIFAPHGMCMMWNARLIWLHVITDGLVALSYYSIPAALFALALKKKDAIPVRPLVVLFGLFIAFCGAGHAMDIVSIWKPIYWVKGLWNIGTALLSVATAIVLIPKVAGFMALPDTTARLEREKAALQEKHGVLRTVLNSISEGILLTSELGEAIAHNPAAMTILAGNLTPDWSGPEGVLLIQDKIVEYTMHRVEGLGFIYVLRDITEKRRSDESRLRLEHVIATMNNGFAIVSLRSGVIESTNAAMENMFGRVMQGCPAEDLFGDTPEEKRTIFQAIQQAAEEHKSWVGETRCVNAQDEVFFTFTRVSEHAGQGGRFLSVIQADITEQKRMRAEADTLQRKLLQAQKLESLGVLAGGVAHDFNNLLTGIMGNASLALYTSPISDEIRERLEDVITASSRAAELTRQMLTYAGKGHFILQPVDISALVKETKALVQHSISRGVEVHLDLDADLPLVEADSMQIQQLLMNLVINGAEAAGDAAGKVEMKTSVREILETEKEMTAVGDRLPPGKYVSIEVKDNGCGMNEETLSHIFDPFFTTKFTGRGLGLAAALGIVRSHNGGLKVESAPGAGTTFLVFFPAMAEGVPAPVETVPASDLSGTGTVLVVDDEETVRGIAFYALRHYGYDVLQASNGMQAVETFNRLASKISIVLLDATMPVMSGAETILKLRNIRADIPVLLMSGFTETEAMERFKGSNLSGFLQKPFTSLVLARVVKQALQAPFTAG